MSYKYFLCLDRDVGYLGVWIHQKKKVYLKFEYFTLYKFTIRKELQNNLKLNLKRHLN